MRKNVVIVALLALTLFLCARIVHIENERYALFLGMCGSPPDNALPALQCLETVKTRTSPLWHLHYALFD